MVSTGHPSLLHSNSMFWFYRKPHGTGNKTLLGNHTHVHSHIPSTLTLIMQSWKESTICGNRMPSFYRDRLPKEKNKFCHRVCHLYHHVVPKQYDFLLWHTKREKKCLHNAVTKNGLVYKKIHLPIHFPKCSSEKSSIALLGTCTFIHDSLIWIWQKF